MMRMQGRFERWGRGRYGGIRYGFRRARSRLYRNQILQENMRSKKMCVGDPKNGTAASEFSHRSVSYEQLSTADRATVENPFLIVSTDESLLGV